MSSADITGDDHTLHFALASGLYKNNRIPPRGSTHPNAVTDGPAVWHGAEVQDNFTAAEYAGGCDDVVLAEPVGAVSYQA